jgi:RecA-family ATPase
MSTKVENFFSIKTVNEWMEIAKCQENPKMIFDAFWKQGELCILFADTGLGKTVLSVQIADSICKGEPIHGFKLEVPKQKVLYFDFELSEKQFQSRYTNDVGQEYLFDNNFLRVKIDTDFELSSTSIFERLLIEEIEKALIENETEIIIIDNLTYLRSDVEKARDASLFMRELNQLKRKHGLSILVIAHPPKRDPFKPITKNDLSGSKVIMNLVDSSFTIGESQKDKSLRYLKQIKVRTGSFEFDIDNVCICSILKVSVVKPM